MSTCKKKSSMTPLIIINGNRRELEYKMLLKVAYGSLTEDDLDLLKKRGNLKLVDD